MNVRIATIHDIDSVARLLSIIRMKQVPASEIHEIFADIIASKYADVLLAIHDDVPVGIAVVNGVLKLNRIECRVDDVVVDPAVRGGGAGTALFKACADWAWSRDCYKIEFTSRTERSSAQRFYEKMGYTVRESKIFVTFSPHTDYVKTDYHENQSKERDGTR